MIKKTNDIKQLNIQFLFFTHFSLSTYFFFTFSPFKINQDTNIDILNKFDCLKIKILRLLKY